MASTNLSAFLTLIRTGEGTLGENGYRTLYGGELFDGWDDHPRRKIRKGGITSSAAGAYQILEKTWDGLRKQHPDLTDFSPANQDRAAVYLINGRKAYDDVVAGRFRTAIEKCNEEWASLPGSPYGQPTLTWEKAIKVLRKAGAPGPALPIMQEPYPQENDMALPAIIWPILTSLAGKLPELAATMAKPNVSERNVEMVGKIAEVITAAVPGAPNLMAAAAQIEADPDLAKQVDNNLRLSRADIMDIMEREHKLRQDAIASARDYNRGDKPVWGNIKFVHIFTMTVTVWALGFLTYAFALLNDQDPLRVQIITAAIALASIGGAYWLGSSNGSDRKTDALVSRD